MEVNTIPLIFNIQGRIQRVRKAQSNIDYVKALHELGNEFYKTMGILFSARYIHSFDEAPDDEWLDNVTDLLHTPSMNSWIQITEDTASRLGKIYDEFGMTFG